MNTSEMLSNVPVTLAPGTSICEAAQRMQEARLRHLAVLKNGQVVGIVNRADIIPNGGPAGRPAPGAPAEASPGDPFPRSVEQIMSEPVRTVHPSLSLDRIVELLISHKCSALPVTDDEGFVGLITKTDLLRWYCRFCRAHPSNPSATCSVRSRMQHNVLTVSADNPADAALADMTRTDIHHLPVTSGKKLVGMVSDGDLRRALGLPSPTAPHGNAPHEPGQGGPTVGAVMSPEPATIEPEETMARAAGLMLERGIGALPVVAGDAVVGIITCFDVLRLIRSLVVCAAA